MPGDKLPPPPRRPTPPLGIRLPEDEAISSSPPSIKSDSRELILRQLKEVEARAQKRIKALSDEFDHLKEGAQRAIADLSEVFEHRVGELDEDLARARAELREKQEELDLARQREHDATVDHNAHLDRRLEDLMRQDQALAARIAELARPQLEASGAVGAKAVTDEVEKSRKRREIIRDIIVALALAGGMLWNTFGKALTADAPPPPLPPAPTSERGPGYGGRF